MVKFKTLKFKHFRHAQILTRKLESGDIDDSAVIQFAASLVRSWDFVDEDTQKQIPVSLEGLDELSILQVQELSERFAEEMEGKATVPKANAGHSHSISTP